MFKYISLSKDKYLIFILFIIALPSCYKGKYIEDDLSPSLPKYSESGNNIGGAYMLNYIWRTEISGSFPYSPNLGFYIYRHYSSDSTIFSFSGKVLNDINDHYVDLDFTIPNIRIASEYDLKTLDNQKIVLDGVNSYVTVSSLYSTDRFDKYRHIKGKGEFFIKKVQQVIKEKDWLSHFIVSGTFNAEISTLKITDGRFDFKVTQDNIR